MLIDETVKPSKSWAKFWSDCGKCHEKWLKAIYYQNCQHWVERVGPWNNGRQRGGKLFGWWSHSGQYSIYMDLFLGANVAVCFILIHFVPIPTSGFFGIMQIFVCRCLVGWKPIVNNFKSWHTARHGGWDLLFWIWKFGTIWWYIFWVIQQHQSNKGIEVLQPPKFRTLLGSL